MKSYKDFEKVYIGTVVEQVRRLHICEKNNK